jgi:toxin-antitoxin system PIN domain toxin
LCDTNIWLALVIDLHVHHERAQLWLDGIDAANSIHFCRDTQRSLLRLLTNRGLMNRYALPAVSNVQAWLAYDSLLADYRITYQSEEPAGLEHYWRDYSARATASTNLWMDAYLAAFARAGDFRLVTADAAFRQFDALDLLLLSNA